MNVRPGAFFVVALLVTTLVGGPGSLADDWPQWFGPGRDGISHETDWQAHWPEPGPPRLWQRKVGTGYSGVAVRGARVYTMGNDGRSDVIWCLDADTGEEVWKFSYTCKGGGGGWPGTRITPTLDGNRLYTLSLKGHVHCLDADTGEAVWSIDTAQELGAGGGRHGFSCHPFVVGDRVIFELGARAGALVAFDKASGSVLWQAGTQKVGHSSPVLGARPLLTVAPGTRSEPRSETPAFGQDRRCLYQAGAEPYLILFTASGLVGMSLKDGEELWFFPCQIQYGCSIATPIISGNRVFISSLYYDKGSALLSLAGDTPTVVWYSKELANHCSSSVLWEGYLYGFDGPVDTRAGKGVLKCLDFETGRVKWAEKGFGTGSLMLADGRLIILGDRGDLAVAQASPEGFQLISRAKALEGRCWGMPVLSDGRIYCRSFEGDLVCVDVRKQ